MPLAALVPKAWCSVLAPALLAPVEALLESEPGVVLPPREQIFAALAHVAPDDVKAVIVGQDPYPTPGNANGLAFSVSPGVKVPASLRNVFAALEDEGWPRPTSGDLTPWTRQGVLLLNTVLTVRQGEPASHKKRGWEAVTTRLLSRVNESRGPVVFLALGKPAQQMADALVDRSRHAVLSLPHPSPLNGKAFVVAAKAMKPFARTNELLVAGGRTPIDWTID